MKARDILTLVGALLSAIGKPMMIQSPTPTLFWIGMVADSAGSALLGARAIMHDGERKPSKATRTRAALVLIGIIGFSVTTLIGCKADGSFDAQAAGQALDTGFAAWERAERLQHPERYPLNAPARYPDRPVVAPVQPFQTYAPVGE